MGAVIAADDLTKRFGGPGGVTAVDRVSLRVRAGEIYGFVGLNGAGKTTTIRMLLGMIRPTDGRASLLGKPVDPGRGDVWSRVGYMVEIPHAYPELTVAQNLEISRRLRGVTDERAVRRTMDLLALTQYQDRRAGVLSLGNKQRLGLAKALLHGPDLLILDEPTNGLDPAGIVEVRRLLRRLAVEEKVTIFLSSHLLGEVAQLADRLGIIHGGRLIQEADSRTMERSLRRRLLVQTRDSEAAVKVLQSAKYAVRHEGAFLVLTDRPAVASPEKVAESLVDAGTPPIHLRVDVEDLESYFLRIIGESPSEDSGWPADAGPRHSGRTSTPRGAQRR